VRLAYMSLDEWKALRATEQAILDAIERGTTAADLLAQSEPTEAAEGQHAAEAAMRASCRRARVTMRCYSSMACLTLPPRSGAPMAPRLPFAAGLFCGGESSPIPV
jgi:hypothetical protein